MYPDLAAPLVTLAPTDPWDPLVVEDFQENQEMTESKARLETLVTTVVQVEAVHQVNRVQVDCRDPQDYRAVREKQALRDHQEVMVILGTTE